MEGKTSTIKILRAPQIVQMEGKSNTIKILKAQQGALGELWSVRSSTFWTRWAWYPKNFTFGFFRPTRRQIRGSVTWCRSNTLQRRTGGLELETSVPLGPVDRQRQWQQQAQQYLHQKVWVFLYLLCDSTPLSTFQEQSSSIFPRLLGRCQVFVTLSSLFSGRDHANHILYKLLFLPLSTYPSSIHSSHLWPIRPILNHQYLSHTLNTVLSIILSSFDRVRRKG